MVITSTANFRHIRSEIIADHMRIETQRMFNENLIPAIKMQLRQSISQNFADLTEDFRSSIAVQQEAITNWQAIVNDLQHSVVVSVRTISHDLWGQKPLKLFVDPTLFEIARVILSTIFQRKDVLAELESKIELSMIQALATEQLSLSFSKDIAKYLHGNLQSRLMATAFAIAAAGEISDEVELAFQLELARQTVATPFDQFFEIAPESFTAEISRLMHVWDAMLLTTLVNSSNDDQFTINELAEVLLCIEEGLANALHHGHANEVTICVATTPAAHTISLIDNGIGPQPGSPGLGSALFNSCAGSRWSLERGPGEIGAKLNLQISK